MSLERLDPRRSLVMLIDVQERLSAAMSPDRLASLTKNALIILESARILSVPVIVTEQYVKGLGPTIAPLQQKITELGITPIEKLTFDAMGEPRVTSAVAEMDPANVIVLGMESHVCVFQTVRELRRRRMRVVVAGDAVISRTDENRAMGLALAERMGAMVMPTEGIVFDWMERAGTDTFRAISKLVR